MKRLICILACACLCLTGCANVELTDKEMGMVSEYAAYVVLKHNRMYHSKLQDEVYETEPETTMVITTAAPETATGTAEEGDSTSTKSTMEDIATVADGLGLSDFQVEYTGYNMMKSYEDSYFSFSATADNVLLVLHFNITNNNEQEMEADVLKNQLKFRCTVNKEKRVGSQLTMLVNDLYSFKEVIAPKETKEAILIFQLPGKYENAIESLDFTVKNGEETHRYTLPSQTYTAPTVTVGAEQETTVSPDAKKAP